MRLHITHSCRNPAAATSSRGTPCMHLTLQQLRLFGAAARNNSFTRAAEEIPLAQPAGSFQVKRLESQAGLFHFGLIRVCFVLPDQIHHLRSSDAKQSADFHRADVAAQLLRQSWWNHSCKRGLIEHAGCYTAFTLVKDSIRTILAGAASHS